VSGMNRRSFLRNVSVAGAGVMLAIALDGCSRSTPAWPNRRDGALQPNAFLQLLPDGRVLFLVPKTEMGQGAMTGLATLIAEELGVDPLALQCELAEPHPDYVDPEYLSMLTGGSNSLRGNFDRLRSAGATLREMLRAAAATQWQLPLADCVAADGAVRSSDGTRRAGYGELAATAATLPVPPDVALKPRAAWQLIGRHDARVDAPSKVDGSAGFGIDVSVPGMLTAVLVRCPHFGGKLLSCDAAQALASAGVQRVLEFETAVAVVADGYWQARRGAERLQLEWVKGPLAGLDSAAITAAQRERLRERGHVVRDEGEAPDPERIARTLTAEYRVPYLAHAAMEPLAAVASVADGRAEIWAGTQGPDVLQAMVARRLGIAREAVRVHPQLVGGAFGRRTYMDFVLEAVDVATAIGKPVKLVWSREDDMRHDRYRPAALAAMRADFDAEGALLAWEARIVSPSVLAGMVPLIAPLLLPEAVPASIARPIEPFAARHDPMNTEGASGIPYYLPRVRIESLLHDPGIPVGVWRSVGNSQNAFFSESFVDEVAHALGEDPLKFRLTRLPIDARERKVLELVAEKAAWGMAPPGVYQGVAVLDCFQSAVAEIVEVELVNAVPRVRRVLCAVDCGTIVNPDVVRMQLESAVVLALTAALYGEITIADGAVEQGSLDDYPLLRIDQCPPIETYFVPSDAPPTGIGEPGVPPLAPALANAIFAATGQRVRELPLMRAFATGNLT
jgi:isoquinoline 1-oxidoreductase beta subunit